MASTPPRDRSPSARGRPAWGAGLLLAALVLVVTGPAHPDQPGQPTRDTEAQRALPPGLDQVPADALAFVHVRVSDLLGGEYGKALWGRLRREAPEVSREWETSLGVAPADLESVTLLWLGPAPAAGAMSPVLFQGPGGMRRGAVTPPPSKAPVPGGAVPAYPAPPGLPGPRTQPPTDLPPEYPRPGPTGISPAGPPPRLPPGALPVRPRPGQPGFEERWDPAPLVLLTTVRPFDRAGLLRRFVLPPRQDDDAAAPGRRSVSILFLGDRSFLLGTPRG